MLPATILQVVERGMQALDVRGVGKPAARLQRDRSDRRRFDEEERVARRHWHWMRPFLRKMGLRCELTKLRSVVARADEWLKRHEGFLGLMLPSETMLNIPRGKITFLVGIPTIPRWPKGEKSSWSKGN